MLCGALLDETHFDQDVPGHLLHRRERLIDTLQPPPIPHGSFLPGPLLLRGQCAYMHAPMQASHLPTQSGCQHSCTLGVRKCPEHPCTL